MAKTKRAIAGRFLKEFEKNHPSYKQASDQAQKLLEEILKNSPALIHVIKSRCKDPSSLQLKLAEKAYGQPKRQVTDLIAARVITYYQDGVPLIVKRLRETLDINDGKSINKKAELEVVEFGYTSVHLIARTRGSWSTSPEYFALRDKWFEIQVRSVLEHAWAEIEHEVVYKSGIRYPVNVKRRFARIAGAIELIEDEFVALRDHQNQMIDDYVERYKDGKDGGVEIDTAMMIAVMECERPESLGWRRAAQNGYPFEPHLDNICVKALRRTGIRTGKHLAKTLRSRDLKSAEAFFAREHRLSEPPSHLNTARLAVLLESSTIFSDYFSDQLSDPVIQRLMQRQRGGKG